MQAQVQAQREQAVRDEFTQATGIKDAPKSREGKNLLRNWGGALVKTLRHVCTTAERVSKQIEKQGWLRVAKQSLQALTIFMVQPKKALTRLGTSLSTMEKPVISQDLTNCVLVTMIVRLELSSPRIPTKVN